MEQLFNQEFDNEGNPKGSDCLAGGLISVQGLRSSRKQKTGPNKRPEYFMNPDGYLQFRRNKKDNNGFSRKLYWIMSRRILSVSRFSPLCFY